jgi:hypothetical protein
MSSNRRRYRAGSTRSSGPASPVASNLDDGGDWVAEFVMAVLRIGLMLEGVLSNLLEDLPDDAFPGEDAGVVLIEMLTGTIRPAAMSAGERVVRDATALLYASGDLTIEGLKGALALRRAMDRDARYQG